MKFEELIRRHLVQQLPFIEKEVDFIVPPQNEVDILTLPPKWLWEGYGVKPEEFLDSGKEEFLKIHEIIKTLNIPKNGRILDFGCATSRLLRYFFNEKDKEDLWGVDVNENHIAWNKNTFSNYANFLLTTHFPHLPFKDNHFSFIYASSVFTHINNLADSWLGELSRIILKDKYLLVSINDERALEQLLKHKSWSKHPFAKYIQTIKDEINLEKYPKWTNNNTLKTLNHTFYNRDYFIDNLAAPFFDLVEIKESFFGFQTALVLKNKF